jgi:DNA-binding MarR family transcriptional regulator
MRRIPRQTVVLKRLAIAQNFASSFWLSHSTGLTTAQVSAALRQMLKYGWVKPHCAQRSGRRYWWSITEAGRKIVEELERT